MKLAERFNPAHYAYAHRGLWSPLGPSENSLEAFTAAAHAGLGLEFDVRPTRDGEILVFHDPDLNRMTQASGLVENYALTDLQSLELRGGEKIITLDVLLCEWPRDLPLLCEMKIDGATDPKTFANAVCERLQAYNGKAAIMSFSRRAVAAIPETLMKAQLLYPSFKVGQVEFDAAMADATTNTDIDYICCHTSNVDDLQSWRNASGKPLATYTVRDADQCSALMPLVDAQIFEGFDPALVKPR